MNIARIPADLVDEILAFLREAENLIHGAQEDIAEAIADAIANSAPLNRIKTMARANGYVPLFEMGMGEADTFSVVDLWTGESQLLSESDLHSFNVNVEPINFRIFKIVPYN